MQALPNNFDSLHITGNNGVCEKHFLASDIVWVKERKKPVEGAVPCIFNNFKRSTKEINNEIEHQFKIEKLKNDENERQKIKNLDCIKDFMKNSQLYNFSVNFADSVVNVMNFDFEQNIIKGTLQIFSYVDFEISY